MLKISLFITFLLQNLEFIEPRRAIAATPRAVKTKTYLYTLLKL
jgi:hypothetical protein